MCDDNIDCLLGRQTCALRAPRFGAIRTPRPGCARFALHTRFSACSAVRLWPWLLRRSRRDEFRHHRLDPALHVSFISPVASAVFGHLSSDEALASGVRRPPKVM